MLETVSSPLEQHSNSHGCGIVPDSLTRPSKGITYLFKFSLRSRDALMASGMVLLDIQDGVQRHPVSRFADLHRIRLKFMLAHLLTLLSIYGRGLQPKGVNWHFPIRLHRYTFSTRCYNLVFAHATAIYHILLGDIGTRNPDTAGISSSKLVVEALVVSQLYLAL
jgi:hypothetical protein